MDRFAKCRYRFNRVGIRKAGYIALDFDFDLGDGNDTTPFAGGRGDVGLTGGAGDDALTQSGSASATSRAARATTAQEVQRGPRVPGQTVDRTA